MIIFVTCNLFYPHPLRSLDNVIGVNFKLVLSQYGHLLLVVAILSTSIQDAHQKHALHIKK